MKLEYVYCPKCKFGHAPGDHLPGVFDHVVETNKVIPASTSPVEGEVKLAERLAATEKRLAELRVKEREKKARWRAKNPKKKAI